uniref:Uncharacterized protein n=1 Tax=Glossina austeni TaxID=7395 RepID=A0A1A9UWN3_GLOAU
MDSTIEHNARRMITIWKKNSRQNVDPTDGDVEYQAFCFGFKSYVMLLGIAMAMVMRYHLYSTAATIQFEAALSAAFSIVCKYKQVLSTNIAEALQYNTTQHSQ